MLRQISNKKDAKVQNPYPVALEQLSQPLPQKPTSNGQRRSIRLHVMKTKEKRSELYI